MVSVSITSTVVDEPGSSSVHLARDDSDDEDEMESILDVSSSPSVRKSVVVASSNENNTSGDVTSTVTEQRTKLVNRSKFLVYLSLLVAATTIGTLTYILTERREEDNFRVTVSCVVFGVLFVLASDS